MKFIFSILLLSTVPNTREYPTEITDLVSALEGNDKKMRLYAARELKRQAKEYVRKNRNADADSIEFLESRQKLAFSSFLRN